MREIPFRDKYFNVTLLMDESQVFDLIPIVFY